MNKSRKKDERCFEEERAEARMLEKYKRFGNSRTGKVAARWQGVGVREKSKRGASSAVSGDGGGQDEGQDAPPSGSPVRGAR